MTRTSEDRLEAWKQARAKDEPFWVDQERHIQGALGQPCCTLSGIAAGLMQIDGSFAVVVHGEDECAACFRHLGPSVENYYCTGLTEPEFVTGRTQEPLRRCLRAVAGETDVDAIFVLGACPVEVIGDRFETVVAEIQKEFPDVPMVAMHTSGLKVGTQAAMLDWMFESLASLSQVAPPKGHWDPPTVAVPPSRQRSVNLVGLPRWRERRQGPPEIARILSSVGLTLIGSYPEDATFDDWRSVHHASHSFVVDRSLYPKLVNVLEGTGQQVQEIPLPTGLSQSVTMYRAIAEAYGLQAEMEAAIAPEVARATVAIEAFRARFAGVRLAYGIRMLNNYAPDQLAYQGLGDFLALQEMGFDLTLLVQGPPDKRERFQQMFARRNIHTPFEMFLEPWVLADVLKNGRFDVACVADHSRSEAAKAGVPMIESRGLRPYLDNVGENLARFERMLVNVIGKGSADAHRA